MRSRFAIRSLALAACLCLLATGHLALARSPSFTALGDLPGGDFQSSATGVSADGSFVVGQSNSPYGGEDAFCWTASGGMVRLRDLHDGSYISPYALSADGLVVVGYGGEAKRWTITDGTTSLGV